MAQAFLSRVSRVFVTCFQEHLKKLMTGLREYIRDQNKKAVVIALGESLARRRNHTRLVALTHSAPRLSVAQR